MKIWTSNRVFCLDLITDEFIINIIFMFAYKYHRFMNIWEHLHTFLNEEIKINTLEVRNYKWLMYIFFYPGITTGEYI